MKTITIILTSILLILGYIVVINALSSVNVKNLFSNTGTAIPEGCTIINASYYECSNSGFTQKVGISDQLSFSIERPRWYGTIYESGKEKNVKIFGLINLPLKHDGTDYGMIHIFAFLSLMAIISIMFLIKYEQDHKTTEKYLKMVLHNKIL